MPALTDYDLASLSRQLQLWGHKPSHAVNLLRRYYLAAGRLDLSVLKLGKALSARLRRDLPLRQSTILRRLESSDGTIKILVGFSGGGAVESVLMPAHDRIRAAGCISSQVGCAMKCDFCASTQRGLERNLKAGEMVEQFLHLREIAASISRRLSTLVFMGMGEPLNNLDELLPAIRRIASPGLGELGGRQITISTVGIVPGIDCLADADLNVHLALSLHAPDDETRNLIVPMNRKYAVADIMAAARRFQQRTGRIVNIEYCLLSDMNDSPDHARKLAALMHGFRAHVNLIPFNPVGPGLSGRTYQPASEPRAQRFLAILTDAGVVAHIRRPRGADINAACGQLRNSTV